MCYAAVVVVNSNLNLFLFLLLLGAFCSLLCTVASYLLIEAILYGKVLYIVEMLYR